MSKLYQTRDLINQGVHYTKHVCAMTSEELHSKSDIAAELAHRDIKVDALVEALEKARHMLWSAKCNMHGDGTSESVEISVKLVREDIAELDEIIKKVKS